MNTPPAVSLFGLSTGQLPMTHCIRAAIIAMTFLSVKRSVCEVRFGQFNCELKIFQILRQDVRTLDFKQNNNTLSFDKKCYQVSAQIQSRLFPCETSLKADSNGHTEERGLNLMIF